MDNSKINQTELSYNNGISNAKVNLYTGRLLCEQPLVTIGSNNFQIGLSLIYNSQYKNIESNNKVIGFGNGWKLNIQQYLFLYDSIYNINGFNTNDYVYIDESFYIHRFVEYKSISENGKQVKVYYDKSGSGLRLYVREEKLEILDDNNNSLVFNSDGKLVEIKSGVNANIKKVIEYDENNNVISICDSRKATRKLEFTYDNLLLKKIIVNDSNITFDLIYDEQNNLINVVKNNTTEAKEKVCFKYNSLNLLEYSINMKGLNAMQFDYQLENNIIKIKTVKIGAVKKESKIIDTDAEVYLGDEIFTGESYYIANKGKRYDGYELVMPNNYIKTLNTFDYFNNSTSITNEKEMKIVYFFNIYGYTSCVLEQDLDGTYNTLFKTNGWSLKNTEYNDKCINGSGAFTLSSTHPTISSDATAIKKFYDTFYDNEDKYKYVENFVISFWVKFSVDLTNDVNVKAIIKKLDLDDIEAKTILNKTFKDAWQYVTIPVYIGEYQQNVYNITLDFNNLPEGVTIDVADFRIAIGNYNYLTISGNKFSDARYIRYIVGNEDVRENISSEFFMTESDIFKTYKNLYYKNIKEEDTFDLVYCAGTKVKEVTKVICDIGYREFEFTVNNLGISNYDIRSINRISSNKYSLTRNNYIFSYDENAKKHYYQTVTFAGFVKNTTNDYEDEYSKSSVAYYDNGNFYMQQDEYGVVTKNTYDHYGNLIQIKTYNVDDSDGESLKTVYGYGDIEEELREVPLLFIKNNIKQELNYNEPFKHLTSSIKGDNEFNLSYDEYLENVTEVSSKDKITSNIESRNNIVYDNYGRVKQVYDQSNRSYGFSYNSFGEILKYYENKKLIVEKKVLRNKILDLDAELDFEVNIGNPIIRYDYLDILTDKVYVEENNPNVTTTIIDKYGRIQLQENNKDVIEYHYQDDENFIYSECYSLAKITSIEDPYFKKTYKYNYDEENKPCGYQIINKDETNNVEFEVMQTANHDTQYIFNHESECIKSKIVLEDEKTNNDESKKYINPRVHSTTYVKTEGKQSDKEENCYEEFHQLYDYDNLGRLSKTHNSYKPKLSNVNEIPTIVYEENIKYKSNTSLVEQLTHTANRNVIYDDESKASYELNTSVNEDITYDNIGNIIKIVESGNRIYKNSNYTYQSINNESYEKTYEYDSVNRLIKETNNKLGNFEYNYSQITNNLLSVKKDNIELKRFIYERGKKVQATIDGLTFNIEYDNFGNVNYDGNVLCHYDKRNLLDICLYTNGEYDYQSNYVYNYQGMRVKKKLQKKLVDMYSVDKEIIYYLDGSRIIGEDWIDTSGNITDQIRYFYDTDGIIGLSHNGNNYSYIKDILGNITKVMHNGRTIAEYVYDAWGNATTYELNVWDNEDQFIVDNNPFRWKSHYLDLETGYYYINGKYYNPILMQYINASSIEQIIQNATVVNSLDRNAITLDNSITFEINPSTIYTATMLYKDPTYEPDKYKSWWELHWKKAITYIIFGAVLLSSLILMCTPAHQFGVGMFVAGLKAAVSGAVVGEVIGGIAALFTGNSFEEGLTSGFIMGFIEGFTTGALLFCASQIGNALPSSANECDPEVPQCFKEGTLVQTKTGHKKIEDIKVNDEVWSYNEKTQKKELKKVKRIFRNKTKQWLHLYIKNEKTNKEEKITCTPSHRIYIKDKGWILANKIVENDKVLLYNDVEGIVLRKEIEKLDSYETTYNFEVEDNHNYYVGQENILVHNDCIKRLDEKKFMKDNAMSREEFHMFKKNVIKDSNLPKKYGSNPDIYYNKDTYFIYLKSTKNKNLNYYKTELTLIDYIVR